MITLMDQNGWEMDNCSHPSYYYTSAVSIRLLTSIDNQSLKNSVYFMIPLLEQ